MSGISSAGFEKKTQAEILTDLEDAAKVQFGTDVDLSVYSPIGQFIQLMSAALANTWDGLEDVYYSAYVDTAEGVSLDRVVALGGITRRDAQKAYGTLTATGTNGTTVAPYTLTVQTPAGVQFQNISSGVVDSGTVSLTIQAVNGGEDGVVSANTIIELTEPFTGITDVANPTATTGGEEIESDIDLQARYIERQTSGGSSVAAIISALKNLDNVTSATCVENETDVTDGDGRPPHSIEVVVGGLYDPAEVAEAIFNAKAAGIATYGSESYTVYDENDDPHVVYWNEPTEVFVNVLVNVTSGSGWISANEETIIQRVIEVVGGVYTDIYGDATEYAGGGIGRNVLAWEIESNFDGIEGMDDIVVYIALYPTTPSSTRKLVMSSAQRARSDNSYVTVSVS